MASVLQLQQVCRDFGGGRGRFGVDLSIGAGEIYGLIGPNGAGKTSLIRAICGRLVLEGGTVRINGSDPSAPDTRRWLGLVSQEIALYRDLTVIENLELLGQLAGLGPKEAKAAVAPALEWVKLADRGGSIVAELSGGSGVAILVATHDLTEAESLADRIGVLVEGTIRAEGSLAALVGRYFGAGVELTLTLSSPANPISRQVLEQAGLDLEFDQRWSGPYQPGVEGLPALTAELTKAGDIVVESVVRQPGLASVFRRATGQEFER